MKLCPLVFASTCFAMSGVANAGVIVVAAGGGGSFTDIQPAVTAAVSGDTILVKSGSYTAFTIDAKGLTIVGDGASAPAVTGRVIIQNIASNQTTTVADLSVTGLPTFPNRDALLVQNCAGAVRFVQCTFKGVSGQPSGIAGRGAFVGNAPNVAFAACSIIGGEGLSGHTCLFDGVWHGERAMSVGNASIAAHDCLIVGGHGGNGGDDTTAGSDGVELTSGFVLAARCNVQGGHGGDSDCYYMCGDNGGNAYDIAASATAWVLDSMVVGGLGGTQSGGIPNNNCTPGDQGVSYPASTPFSFAAPSIGFTIPFVAREGDYVKVKFIGPPGAYVYLNDELTTSFSALASWRGVLLSPFADTSGPPVRARRWGVIPASGELNQVYRVPLLPSGELAQTHFLQAYRIGPNGITLGSFKTLTVVDSSL